MTQDPSKNLPSQVLQGNRDLVGRLNEQKLLASALQSGQAGQGKFITIGGDAGVGKTTLVRSFVTEAIEAGAYVLTGHCFDLEITQPYGPWIEIILEHIAGGKSPEPPETLIDPSRLGATDSADKLHQVAAQFFLDIAANNLLVIVLEDQHWADQASLEFLRVLARRAASARMLIIMTYRDTALARTQPLYRLLPLLIRESQASRIALRPLDKPAIIQLIASRYSLATSDEQRLLEYVWRYGGGNPFFTEEILNALQYDGLLTETDETWTLGDISRFQIPPLVAQFIENQLSRLDPQSLEALEIASVIGPEVQLSTWHSVSGWPEDELIEVIEQAVEQRIFEEDIESGAYRFRHTLIRAALYNQLILPRRRIWHRKIGETLARQAAPVPDTVAHHFQQAGDPRAATWFYRAGILAESRYAWRIAIERFEEADRLLAKQEDSLPTRAWLLYHISCVYRRFDVQQAQTWLAEANDIALEIEDRLLGGHCLVDRGSYRCFLGELQLGLVDLEEGLRLLDEQVHGARIDLEVAFGGPSTAPDPRFRRGILVNWLAAAGRYQESIAMGEPFVSERQPSSSLASDPIRYEDFYDAYIGLGQAYIAQGRPEAARFALDRALEGYRAIERLPWLFFRAEIDYHVAYTIDQSSAQREIQDLLIAGYQPVIAQPESASSLRHELLLFLHGDWTTIEDQAPGTLKRMPAGVTRLTVTTVLGLIARHRGNPETVNRLLASVFPSGPGTLPGNDWFPIAVSLLSLAAASALEAGDQELAVDWIDSYRRWLDWAGSVVGRSQLELLRAGLALIQKDANQAIRHTEEAIRYASDPRQPLALQAAHQSMARLLMISGQFEQASTHIATALQLAEDCNTPFEQALTLLAFAEIKIAMRELDEVPDLLKSTREILEPLRAKPALEHLVRIEERLDELQAGAQDHAGLSPRELEVLQLIVEGHTDREIAEQLFISPRTVMNHVSNILNKLGVNSRAAAAAAAIRQDII